MKKRKLVEAIEKIQNEKAVPPVLKLLVWFSSEYINIVGSKIYTI